MILDLVSVVCCAARPPPRPRSERGVLPLGIREKSVDGVFTRDDAQGLSNHRVGRQSIQMNDHVIFGRYIHPQAAQGILRGAVRHVPGGVEARAVTGTGEAVCARVHRAAEVRADQAQGCESVWGVEQQRRDVREQRA